MPCVTMTPSMLAPPDGRCGASASSATVRPLPAHDAPRGEAHVSTSMYTRFWQFLFHHWHATQPKTIEDSDAATRRRRRLAPSRLSASSEMRQRVDMLQELEAHPHSRGLRAMQATCANCRQRFFRAHGADAQGDKPTGSEFCSLDCRSSAQYRALVQHSIDHDDAFSDTADSSPGLATSRL